MFRTTGSKSESFFMQIYIRRGDDLNVKMLHKVKVEIQSVSRWSKIQKSGTTFLV